MKSLIACTVCIAVLAGAGSAVAQFEQDKYESSKGEGTGQDRASAIEAAKRDAVAKKVVDLVDRLGLSEYKEKRAGVDALLKNKGSYIGRVEVRKVKEGMRPSKQIQDASESYITAEISAMVNVTKLERDFQKARRIAALRKFGERMGILIEQYVDNRTSPEPVREEGFAACVGAEGQLMVYKFRPISMAVHREKLARDLAAGKSLKDEEFRNDTVEALARAGAHLRIVGAVTVTPGPRVRDDQGRTLFTFTATWWAELYVGDKYRRKLAAQSQQKDIPVAKFETEPEGRELAFKNAGAALALDLATRLADSLEQEEEQGETPPRDVTLVVLDIQGPQLSPLEAAVNKIEGIQKAKRLRFGSGYLVMRLTVTLGDDDLLAALVQTLEAQGFSLASATKEKIQFGRG